LSFLSVSLYFFDEKLWLFSLTSGHPALFSPSV
jgi:hypothetical protein